MPTTFQAVQKAAEQEATAALQPIPASIVFGNINDAVLSNGTVPWAKMIVIEQKDVQTTLGIPSSSRVGGTCTFILYVRKDAGMGKHTQMREAIKARFRSKIIGGATFLNARSTTLGELGNWSLTGVEVPFYFDKP
jgi:hypothetical protein